MTSDGDIVNKILRSRNNHEKVYEVRVNKPITKQFIDQMSKGIPILDTVTDPCKVEQMDRFYFKITLTQGLNRQIRKMCAYLNYEVYKLKRIKIMNIELDVPYGEWRYLNNEELREIHRLVKDSHKTFDSEI
jgi:23S rRNA pseudouridine2604 synthase